MAIVDKQTLKGYFEQGDIPTQGQYVNLIDSTFNLSETGAQIIQGTLQAQAAEIDVLNLKKAHLPGIGISRNVAEAERTGSKIGSSFQIGKSLEVVGSASVDYLYITGGALSASNGIMVNDVTSSRHISGSKRSFTHQKDIRFFGSIENGAKVGNGFTIGPALYVKGTISSSGNLFARDLEAGRNITASNDISASGNLKGYGVYVAQTLYLGTGQNRIANTGTAGSSTYAFPDGGIELHGVLDITDTTDATDASGDTGALRTEGGASIAKQVHIGDKTFIKGNLVVGIDDAGHDVKFFGATSGKYMESDESNDQLNIRGRLSIGLDDTGHDVRFYGATSGKYMEWDESDDQLHIAGELLVDDEIKGEFNRPYQTVTGDQTLAIGHGGQYLRWTHTGDNSMKCTVPPNSSVAYNLGTEIEIFQSVATGHIKLIAGSGVTLNSRHGLVSSSGQFSAISLKKIATDEWDVIGDLTA